MEKHIINYVVDMLMFVSFIVSAVTALIIFFFLPGGVPRGRYQEFLGIIKDTWANIHDWSGIAFIALVLIHIILHWKWIVCMTQNLFLKKIDKNRRM